MEKEKERVKKKKEMKILKVFEILDAKAAIDTLMENNEKFNLKTGFKLCQIEQRLSEMEDYIFERLFKVIDEKKIELGEMNEEEMVIYQSVMETEMEVELFGLTRDELINGSDIKIDLNEIKALTKLFDEKCIINMSKSIF